MKCICGGEYTLRKGKINFTTRFLGKTVVPDIEFYKCETCKDQLLSPEESDKAIDYIRDKEQKAGFFRKKGGKGK